MVQITPELVNLNLKQINYLIDFVIRDIEIENTNYKCGLGRYAREGLPTQKQCCAHLSKSMEQHELIRQLYVMAGYSVLSEAKMYPERFGKAGSELCSEWKTGKSKSKEVA
tara:strand:- start:200 stop:532 length:333 start_codon:yes stop_codon:yes gene_type:complete